MISPPMISDPIVARGHYEVDQRFFLERKEKLRSAARMFGRQLTVAVKWTEWTEWMMRSTGFCGFLVVSS